MTHYLWGVVTPDGEIVLPVMGEKKPRAMQLAWAYVNRELKQSWIETPKHVRAARRRGYRMKRFRLVEDTEC